ncbi:bcl-2-like protein 15 [Sinocyclocheilus grahami]|uniref:bcl-2-like protein 15 n=1 Tax=Sinocyclocheilus grahami TaxID=75366 RepID=UPI0007AC9D5D|nr:PREDICTED: bcl-2-like protein 15 [Sinocyclocheilus grahami]
MAAAGIQKQTYHVIHCLLQNERDVDMVETDGPEDENSFDPVKIAHKLRELGDDYDEKVIQPLMKNVQGAAADQVVTVFSDSVDSLCKMWVVERAEVASEKQLLKAAITLGLFMKKNCPAMTNVVEVAMMGFVNNRLTNWIAEQGGWVSVSVSSMC